MRSLLEQALGEAGPRFDSSLKRAINKDLRKKGLGGSKRYQKVGVALADAADVFADHGIQFDDVLDANIFRSHPTNGVMGGRRVLQVAFSDPDNAFNTFPITTSGLSFAWTDLDDRVEVIAYMS